MEVLDNVSGLVQCNGQLDQLRRNPCWLLSCHSEKNTNNNTKPCLSTCGFDLYASSANIPTIHRKMTRLQTSQGQEILDHASLYQPNPGLHFFDYIFCTFSKYKASKTHNRCPFTHSFNKPVLHTDFEADPEEVPSLAGETDKLIGDCNAEYRCQKMEWQDNGGNSIWVEIREGSLEGT